MLKIIIFICAKKVVPSNFPFLPNYTFVFNYKINRLKLKKRSDIFQREWNIRDKEINI